MTPLPGFLTTASHGQPASEYPVSRLAELDEDATPPKLVGLKPIRTGRSRRHSLEVIGAPAAQATSGRA